MSYHGMPDTITAMSATRTTITRKDAERVLAAVKRQCAAWCTNEDGTPTTSQPEIREDWAWSGSEVPFAIVWEEGPYEWAYLFPFGGREPEFGFNMRDVSGKMPAHAFCEAMTSWAIAIYVS